MTGAGEIIQQYERERIRTMARDYGKPMKLLESIVIKESKPTVLALEIDKQLNKQEGK